MIDCIGKDYLTMNIEDKYAEDEIKLPVLTAADGTPIIDESNGFSD